MTDITTSLSALAVTAIASLGIACALPGGAVSKSTAGPVSGPVSGPVAETGGAQLVHSRDTNVTKTVATAPGAVEDDANASAVTLLSAVETGIRLRYFDVEPIGPHDLINGLARVDPAAADARVGGDGDAAAAGAARQTGVLLFDVRTPAEFETSHLKGAIRIDPDMTATAFKDAFGEQLAGRTAVFYCSVGVRSAKMISRLNSAGGLPAGMTAKNLEGGIFRWHNEKRPLVDANGPTDLVHRFDTFWGRLVARQSLVVDGPVVDGAAGEQRGVRGAQ